MNYHYKTTLMRMNNNYILKFCIQIEILPEFRIRVKQPGIPDIPALYID